ncbi:MAG TPA: CCA tRNA nucleotidyltransferase, partial [Terriglobia bacterium]
MEGRTLAERICRTLHDAGHQAYLVGGCVRDLLLRRAPKDYDVATDAHPHR